jgi:ABC-type multidrug transport system ATPase subunit
VFLDEASSSLDPASELLMYSALKKHLPPHTTVLAVSHRYDREGIRSLCTQVLELDHGRLTKYEDIFFL